MIYYQNYIKLIFQRTKQKYTPTFYFIECNISFCSIQMNQGQVQKIKTEISEGSREEKIEQAHHSKLNLSSTQDMRLKYDCDVCRGHRIVCPCSENQPKRYQPFTFKKKKATECNERRAINQSMYQTSRSVPKVTFTYASRQRNHSFSIPKANPLPLHNQLLVKQTTVTTLLPHREEILYYPVIHNVFKAVTPARLKIDEASCKQATPSRKRAKRSFVNHSIQVMKEVSTDESKDPMTPEQFKKFSEWLLQN